MPSALDLAKSFGLEEVLLPSPPGFQAKIRLPSLPELMRKGGMPTELRRAILSQRTAKAGKSDEFTDEQMDIGVDTSTLRAARMVRAVRIGDDQWESVTLGMEDFFALPEDTQGALLEIVNGQKTPAMVTALVRRMNGEISDSEAAAIVEEETPKLVKGWESFRDDGRRAVAGSDSEGVEPTPLKPSRSKRPDAGLRAG